MQQRRNAGARSEAAFPSRRLRSIGAWTALLISAPFLLAGLALLVPIFAVMEAWDWLHNWKSYDATQWWNEGAHEGRFKR